MISYILQYPKETIMCNF